MPYSPTDGFVQHELLNKHPPMKFSAVFAGWLIATATAGLLYIAGLALGFASFDAWNAAGSGRGIGLGTAVWMIITWVGALFVGGLFAAWFDGRNDDTSGALHGVTVWGLSLTTTALWLAFGLTHAMSGHGHATMGAADGDAHGGAASVGGAVGVLDATIASQLSGRERDASPPIVAALLTGQNDMATKLLAADTDNSQSNASATLQRLGPQIDAARAEADRTAHYLSLTLWIAFISGFLSLFAAAVGGWFGANTIHRVYHLRKFPARRLR